MKRTKEWWERLNKEERSKIIMLERADKKGSGIGCDPYLPDDCGECQFCSTPTPYRGLCQSCCAELGYLVAKGKGDTG